MPLLYNLFVYEHCMDKHVSMCMHTHKHTGIACMNKHVCTYVSRYSHCMINMCACTHLYVFEQPLHVCIPVHAYIHMCADKHVCDNTHRRRLTGSILKLPPLHPAPSQNRTCISQVPGPCAPLASKAAKRPGWKVLGPGLTPGPTGHPCGCIRPLVSTACGLRRGPVMPLSGLCLGAPPTLPKGGQAGPWVLGHQERRGGRLSDSQGPTFPCLRGGN